MDMSANGWEYEGDLLRLFPVNEDGGSRRQTPFTDSDFDRISEILENNGKLEWSRVVRTYAILRLIQAPAARFLDDLIKDGIVDVSIPYTDDNLPPRLPPGVKARFLDAQSLVVTKILDLERGTHLSIKSVAAAQLEIGPCLGQGGCARVHKAFSKLSQRHYAVKLLLRRKTFDKDKLAIGNFIKELNTSKKVSHRHIVKVIGSFTERTYIGIIMGTVAEGDLEGFMHSEMDPDRKSDLRILFGCLVSGLKAIHDEKIRHKDIKPKNILIKKRVVLYTDFGIALDYSQTDHSTTKGRPAMFTPQYCAPEVADWKDRNSSSDIFSLAAVFLEMVTRMNDKTIGDLRGFLDGDGAQNSSCYCKCLRRIREWIDHLRTISHGQDGNSIPLNWIRAGLEEEGTKRPTVYELWSWLERDTMHARYPFACHECAAEWVENSDEPDDEPGMRGEERRETDHETTTGIISPVFQDDVLKPPPVLDAKPEKQTDMFTNESSQTQELCSEDSLVARIPKSDLLVTRRVALVDRKHEFGTDLHDACNASDIEVVKRLLEKGADINAQGGHYGNALQAASWGGYMAVVKLLLEKGANINAQGGRYGNALQAASRSGHTEVVKLLLEKGVNINAQGGLYSNALQAASRGDHTEVVKLLLEKGANINAQGGYYGNALQAASRSGHTEVVKLLLEKEADINAQGGHYGNALQAASDGGYMEVVKLLLEKGANINAQGGYPGNALQAASNSGHTEVVKLLLEKGADIDAQGGYYSNALQAASDSGHPEVVKLLLEKEADINVQGK